MSVGTPKSMRYDYLNRMVEYRDGATDLVATGTATTASAAGW